MASIVHLVACHNVILTVINCFSKQNYLLLLIILTVCLCLGCGQCTDELTAGHVEEVLTTGSVDLDVALSDVVLVLAQRQIAMFFAVKTNQRLPVPSSLLTEA